jgi:hypothetical protein
MEPRGFRKEQEMKIYKTDCCGAELKYAEVTLCESVGAFGDMIGHVSYYCRYECEGGKK